MSKHTTQKPRYKWGHPSEWLDDYISDVASRNDTETLTQIARELAQQLDGDQIQDLYQEVMDSDGYFKDLNRPDEDEEEGE